MSESQKRSWTHWFEIPVTDFDRAKKFYETIFLTELFVNDFGSFKMGIFPHKDVGCAIFFGEWYKPSSDGSLVYLDANPDLQETLNRIESAGGKIIQEKKQISEEHGFMALFIDSEGNRMALHSME
ncbi:VOC family protein [candidate division KSB1 bacterium]|nr:VOC family protein [candidate division KSB1 bacterium]